MSGQFLFFIPARNWWLRSPNWNNANNERNVNTNGNANNNNANNSNGVVPDCATSQIQVDAPRSMKASKAVHLRREKLSHLFERGKRMGDAGSLRAGPAISAHYVYEW